MMLPNAHLALVERGKITEYLLNPAHPDNGGKAPFFIRARISEGRLGKAGGGSEQFDFELSRFPKHGNCAWQEVYY
ncbi:MAG: DUF6883 domain-containing protein [Pyrinomonadaceae bacterium]